MEKERIDEMSEVAHYTTKKAAAPAAGGKAGKKPVAKPQRPETRPAPHGQRIVPVIDPAFVKKVNEEMLKRSRVRFFSPPLKDSNPLVTSSFSGRKDHRG